MIILGGLVVVGSFAGATLAINALWPPAAPPQSQVALAPVPPLQPLTGTSTVLAPTAISLAAISEALDARAPKNLSGTPQNPLSKFLSDAQFKFTVTRGPLNVAGQPGALVVTTPLTGTFEALGTLTGAAGSGVSAVGGAIGNLLGGNVGQQVENLAGKAFDQHTDIQGTVTTTARPTIAANWRLAPNLAAQVNVVDVVLPIGGFKLSVGNAVKPVLDKLVHDQTDTLEAYLRNDPFIETAARAEWAKLCRAIPLGAGGAGHAQSVSRNPARARHRGAAEDRRQGGHAAGRRPGANPHRAERDQAELSRFRSSSTSCRRRTRARSASRCRSTFRSPK